MKNYINASDLQNMTGFHIQVCYRRLKKVKQKKNYKPFENVSIGDYIEVFGGNYLEMYCLLNAKTHKEYIQLYNTLKSGDK